MKRISLVLISLTVITMAHSRVWNRDILGEGFVQTTVSLPGEKDQSVCTVINLQSPVNYRKAILYIHGYNDYFFQSEMARQFVDHGYNFYALDLRRYGRSIRENHQPFSTKDLSEYYQDIDSALSIIAQAGDTAVVMLGHSTGGLIAADFMANHPSPLVKALILNSPFLDWNLGWMEKIVGGVAAIGGIFPSIRIPQGNSTAYSDSLLKSAHGEWDYNTDWKMPVSPPVSAGWVKAINDAQKRLRKNKYPIKIPVLLLMSDKSIEGDQWTPEFNKADAVLDVNDIARYGKNLSTLTTARRIRNGLHDLALSEPGSRQAYYRTIFQWLTNFF